MSKTWSVRIVQLELETDTYPTPTGEVPYASLSFKGIFPLVVESPGGVEDVIHEVEQRWPHHLGEYAFIYVMRPGMEPYDLFRGEQPYFYSK